MNSRLFQFELSKPAIFVCISFLMSAHLACADETNPSVNHTNSPTDFLISDEQFKAQLKTDAKDSEITLTNGLIERTWRIKPNAACVSFKNLTSDQQMLRAIRPEARLTIDNHSFNVGGLLGQPNHAFLKPLWIDAMSADQNALQFTKYSINEPIERLKWKQRRHHAPNVKWPPAGKHLQLHFKFPETVKNESHSSLEADRSLRDV